MDKSTPDDLAVTFRSLARRLREAIGDADPATVGGAIGQLHAHVETAAALLGVPADATAVANAIEARPPEAWNGDTLDELRQRALDVGGILRRISALTGADEPDD